jgi:hypothetical protein
MPAEKVSCFIFCTSWLPSCMFRNLTRPRQGV